MTATDAALIAGGHTAGSARLFEVACRVIPAGVNSTARATWSGWTPYPLFVQSGQGSRLRDVDGNEYIDYLLGLGPMIFGHRPPRVTQAVVDFIQQRGTVFALPTADEARLAEKIVAAVPSVEQVRLCNTGTEAVLYATRLARAFTKRNKIIRFEGMYHGFSDGVYWSKHPNIAKAGPDNHPIPVPQGPGMPKGVEENLIILPWNDTDALAETIKREGDSIAAVLTEPVMCNTGCILPQPGYLEAMRELTHKHGIVLIFDEVITGFRLGLARRAGSPAHQARSVGVRQGHRRRFPGCSDGWTRRYHGAGRQRHRVDGGDLHRERHRGGGGERGAR